MYLRTPKWADNGHSPTSTSLTSASSSSSLAVGELVRSLTNRRLYREVALSLRSGLRDAKADFSFIRIKGLKKLLRFLSSVSKSDKTIALFRDSQVDKELQVVPILFEHSLPPPKNSLVLPIDVISCEEPLQITSPPTGQEVALALQVLEGCCLIDRTSRNIASQHKAVKEVIELFSAHGVLEQTACLDALLALMLDCAINQKEFECHHGLQKVAYLMKNSHADGNLRLKCAEFLLLLVGNVLRHSGQAGDSQVTGLVADNARQELLGYLGSECISILNGSNQPEPSFSDIERDGSLHLHAKQLLESFK
eukprot:c23080_g1_i1 orf=47-973(-)